MIVWRLQESIHAWINALLNECMNEYIHESGDLALTLSSAHWHKWPQGKPLNLYAQICYSVKLCGWTSLKISLGFLLSLTTEPMNFNCFISFLRNFSQGGVVTFFWNHTHTRGPSLPQSALFPGDMQAADTEDISELWSSLSHASFKDLESTMSSKEMHRDLCCLLSPTQSTSLSSLNKVGSCTLSQSPNLTQSLSLPSA